MLITREQDAYVLQGPTSVGPCRIPAKQFEDVFMLTLKPGEEQYITIVKHHDRPPDSHKNDYRKNCKNNSEESFLRECEANQLHGRICNDYHYQILDSNERPLIDWWPTTRRMYNHRMKASGFGGVEKICKEALRTIHMVETSR